MSVVIALAGDAMLGPGVAAGLGSQWQRPVLSEELQAVIREADFFVLNLECCISNRGAPWQAPGKQVFFRAPPEAAEVLAGWGVDCVTLANNHALDFGREALLDTIRHLSEVGIRAVGAGPDAASARAPVVLDTGGFRLAVVGITDYPSYYAATAAEAGVAFADLRAGAVPDWLIESLEAGRASADAVLLSPHWGPNLTVRPPQHVRAAAAVLGRHATLIAGHSAHVFHGVQNNVLHDLGNFIDDQRTARPSRSLVSGTLDKLRRESAGFIAEVASALFKRPGNGAAGSAESFRERQRSRAARIIRMVHLRTLRPYLGLVFLLTLDRDGPQRLEALPLKLERGHTRLAFGREAALVHRRFRRACRTMGTEVSERGGRSVIVWSKSHRVQD